MSLSISSQPNSYLKMKLGEESGSSQKAGASSRTQVAQNLQTSSAKTTRSFTLGSKRQSNFVVGQGNTPGVAQRSTRKLQDQHNISRSNQRFYSTGDNSTETVYIRQSDFGSMTNQMAMLNQMQQAGGIQGTISAGFSLVKEIGGFLGLSSQMDTAMGSLGGNNSTVSSSVSSTASAAISGMTSANDSATLRQAIVSAESQESSLESELNADNTTYEQKVSTFQKDIATQKTTVSTQKKAVADAKQDLTNAKNSVSTLTTQRDAKKSALQNAMTKKNECSSAYAQAHANTISAQQTADNTPKEIDGPNGTKIHNPAWDEAQTALKNAKQAEEKAKTDLDKANEATVKADKDVQNAEASLQKAQSQLDKAQTQLDTKQKAYDKAEENLTKAQEGLEKAQDGLDKIKQAKQDYDNLTKEIKTQKERLTKLENKEMKELEKNSNKIDEKNQKIDARSKKIDNSNRTNIKGSILQAKNNRDASKMNKLNDRNAMLQDNIAKTQCMRGEFEEGKDGVELRSCDLPSGGKVYFVGMEEVSEDVYNSHKKASA